MLYVPKFIPKHVEPGIRAIRAKKRGIWLPCRIVWTCPHGCQPDACAGLSSKGRCYGSLSGDLLGADVPWEAACLGAEISELQSAQLSDALFLYDFTAETTFKTDIALERYLRLTKDGEITRYVKKD